MKRERWCGVERLSETVSGCVGAGETWVRARPPRIPAAGTNCYHVLLWPNLSASICPFPETPLVGLQLELVNPLLKGSVR